MYTFLGLLLIFIVIVQILYWYNKDGILLFFDFSRLAFIIWTVGLGLYDLSLSKLYHPSATINIVCLLIVINFYIISLLLPCKSAQICEVYSAIKSPNKNYMSFVYFSLFLGIVSFIINLKNGQLRFFLSNAATETDITLSYLLNLMVVVSLVFYILARQTKVMLRKIIYFLLSGFSLFLIFCNMARGPLVFWGVGVIFYEIIKLVKRRNTTKLRLKDWLIILIVFIVGVVLFGVIGDFRTSSIFNGGASVHYQMPEGTPSGLTWVYIYLTSPLENARVILEEQQVTKLACFNNLFYPFIKFAANFLGCDQEYVKYMASFTEVYPYLKEDFGLNVSSFIADAYVDFSYLGIFIYIIFYDLIAVLTKSILASKKISNLSKCIIFPIIIQIALWSIFSNSIFRITSIWFDIVFVLIWEIFSKIKLHFNNKRI